MNAEREIYSGFASVYDGFMAAAEVPYMEWAGLVHELICRYGVSRPAYSPAAIMAPSAGTGTTAAGESIDAVGAFASTSAEAELLRQERDLVVELGCGTGSFTRAMSGLGYDMLGIDASAEMLARARESGEAVSGDIMYIQQDMRELDLYCTAGTMVSVYDSVNYLLTDEDMLSMLRAVNRFLYPGGIFVFDFNTRYKYRDIMGNGAFPARSGDGLMLWENEFIEESDINVAELTFFIREEDGRYRSFSEIHEQRGYTLEGMRSLVEEAGLRYITALDADSRGEPSAESERIYMVAGERGKSAAQAT